MRVQRRSEAFRYGTPTDHEAGIDNVITILKKQGFTRVARPYRRWFYPLFIAMERLRYDYHEYDIAFWHHTHVYYNDQPDLVVEVDGQRHSSKLVKINDGIAQKFVEQYMPRAHFCRIDKADTAYPHYVLKCCGFQLPDDSRSSTSQGGTEP